MLFAPVLLAWEAWRTRRRAIEVHRRLGVVCLALAPVAMFAGFEAGSPTLGLGGLSLGIIGAASFTGRPAPAVATLALWVVPVPVFLLERLSPGLETFWMKIVGAIAATAGAALEPMGPVAFGAGGARVEFFSVDDGLVLAHGMAMVGYWRGLRRQAPAFELVGRTAAWGAMGFGLQGLVLLAAVLHAAGSDANAALMALTHGPTLVAAAAIMASVVLDARRTKTRGDRAAGV